MATTLEKPKTIQGLSPQLESKLKWKNEQPRIFELTGTGDIDKWNADSENNISGLEVRRGASFPAETTIYDKFDAGVDKVKVIRNITGKIQKQTEGGEVYYESQVESIKFDRNGQCVVQPGEVNLLARVLFSDNCGTNTYRRTVDGTGAHIPILWNEIKDHTAEQQERYRMEEFKDMARQMIKTYPVETVKTRILEFNDKYSFGNKSTDDLRYDLRQYAEADPRYFISNAPDEAVRLGLIVEDALLYGVLNHNHDAKFYTMDGKSFFTYEIQDAENPQAALIKHLVSKKGTEDKKRLQELLKQD